jgi:hypothetical protein
MELNGLSDDGSAAPGSEVAPIVELVDIWKSFGGVRAGTSQLPMSPSTTFLIDLG